MLGVVPGMVSSFLFFDFVHISPAPGTVLKTLCDETLTLEYPQLTMTSIMSGLQWTVSIFSNHWHKSVEIRFQKQLCDASW